MGLRIACFLSTVSVAVANPGFHISPTDYDRIGFYPGEIRDIPIEAVGTGQVTGMELYLSIEPWANFQILDVRAGAGTMWSPGAALDSYTFANGGAPDPWEAALMVSYSSPVASPGIVAIATVLFDGYVGEIAHLSTAMEGYESRWIEGPASGQASVLMSEVPEPAGSLLLLAAMTLLSRVGSAAAGPNFSDR